MYWKNIKYWTPIANNIHLSEAVCAIKHQMWNGKVYERLAIRFGYRIIDKYDDVDKESFNTKEAIDAKWEIIIPDDGKQDLLYKTRELVKEGHFLGITHDKIDNMDISSIWTELNHILVMLDEKSKYRLIKHIIENKLYKKS